MHPDNNCRNNQFMEAKELHDSLVAFANSILDRAYTIQAKGGLPLVSYQRIPARNIDYEDNCFQYDFENVEVFSVWKWQSGDLGQFSRNEVLTLPEYQFAIDEYMLAYGHPLEGAKMALDAFYRYFIERASEGECSYDAIERYVAAFIKECGTDFKTLHWTIELWLGNIYIESDQIELAPGVVLRRADPAQLATIVEYPHYFEELDRFVSHVIPSTVTLTFTLVTPWSIATSLNDPTIVSEVEQWLNVLRLFKPSTLYLVRQISTQRSIFGYRTIDSKEQPGEKYLEGKVAYQDRLIHKLNLKKDDESALISFASKVKPTLNSTLPTAYLDGDQIDLALHRYADSLIKSDVAAYKILSAIMSLEALFTDKNKKITNQLTTRVANIMQHFGFEVTGVFDKVKRAYNFRSRLVHGDSLTPSLREFAIKVCYEIISYNRTCLLVFLLLNERIDRKALLVLIDNSPNDQKAHSDLAQLFRSVALIA